MKKVLSGLISCAIGFSTLICAEGSNQEAIRAIDSELAKLKQELQQSRLKEANEDTEAQSYMIADWSRFEKETQDVERSETATQKIKTRIKELEQKKARLINNTSQ